MLAVEVMTLYLSTSLLRGNGTLFVEKHNLVHRTGSNAPVLI